MFLHGSNLNFNIGDVLKGRLTEYEAQWNTEDFYNVLEHFRPKHMISHKEAVFMCESIEEVELSGAYTNFIFELEPLGKVEKHDLNWTSDISVCVEEDSDDIEKLQDLALNYWSGVPHPDENIWEYLTKEARIVQVFNQDMNPIQPKL